MWRERGKKKKRETFGFPAEGRSSRGGVRPGEGGLGEGVVRGRGFRERAAPDGVRAQRVVSNYAVINK